MDHAIFAGLLFLGFLLIRLPLMLIEHKKLASEKSLWLANTALITICVGLYILLLIHKYLYHPGVTQ